MTQSFRSSRSRGFFVSSFCLGLVACGGGGGGTPSVPAQVPSGTGRTTIQMIGTWEIRAATVLESNDPAALPPLNGTRIVIGVDQVERINGFSVSRQDLEAVVGVPLRWYFNRADGRTVIYGASVDLSAQGGIVEEVGLAGGSVDENTISVEQFNSRRATPQASELFTRARFTLARIAPSSVQLEPAVDGSEASVSTQPKPAPGLAEAMPGLLPR
ncbi:MAG: hypothetical protein MUC36_02045 [Planctomycetes bacterium]|jgi:hypothetical protein|nr:hypothetical protein [Planctomycetota bacterium]